ncbi:hypothetical protein [Biomaibacter acetigenes]|nr:hypothetical protein [Biomaibacter acetigenes]
MKDVEKKTSEDEKLAMGNITALGCSRSKILKNEKHGFCLWLSEDA